MKEKRTDKNPHPLEFEYLQDNLLLTFGPGLS